MIEVKLKGELTVSVWLFCEEERLDDAERFLGRVFLHI